MAEFPEACGGNEVQSYNSRVLLDGIITGTKKALAAGVSVGLGTDTGCPFTTHYDMWRELEYAHKLLKIDRNKALHLGTLANAKILGIDDITGSIEVGKQADMVVVNNNPLDGFKTIAEPDRVIFGGVEYLHPQVKKSEICEKYLNGYLETL